MKKRIFKFISKKTLKGDPLILAVTEQMIQNFARAKYGRDLTDDQLNRIANESFNADDYSTKLNEFLDVVVRCAANQEK